MIPAMLLRPMPRHSLVDLAIHVTTPHRGNARLDLALIATAVEPVLLPPPIQTGVDSW